MDLIPHRHLPGDPALASVHALIHASFAPMQGRIAPPSSVHLLTPAALETTAASAEVWSLGSPPHACVILTAKTDSLYIGKLATASQARRAGHARRLVDLAAQRAHDLGLPALELQSRVELTEVHAFFRAQAFTEVARTAHAGFKRPTSITFRRLLG
jgi:phosphinothricin acetyltransferase